MTRESRMIIALWLVTLAMAGLGYQHLDKRLDAATASRAAEVADLRKQLAAAQLASATELTEVRNQLSDARLLGAFGGKSYIVCDGMKYVRGTYGEAAHRALRATGLCDPKAREDKPAR